MCNNWKYLQRKNTVFIIEKSFHCIYVYLTLKNIRNKVIFGVLEEAYELLLQLEFYLELGACSTATGNRDVELYSRFA